MRMRRVGRSGRGARLVACLRSVNVTGPAPLVSDQRRGLQSALCRPDQLFLTF